MEAVTDKPKRVSPRTLSTKPRCRAKSKQTGQPCKMFPLADKTLCKYHGGPLEKVSAEHLVTHGGRRKYFNIDELPEIIEKIEVLQTTEGRQAALIRGAAVTEHRADKLKDSDEHLELYIKARGSVRGDIALAEELVADKTSQALPVFNIAIGDAASQTFEARTLEGHCTIEMVRGRPYMLDAATGALWPAQQRKDEDSGAEFYERVLVAP
jgi:hypothetical protein